MATRKRLEYEQLDMSLTPAERVQVLLRALTQDPNYKGWDTFALKQLELVNISEGRTEFTLTVTEEMCNKSLNFHGGCAATLLDIISSITLMTAAKPGFMDGGSVSRAFSCNFLAAVPAGSKLRLMCEVARGGKRMSHVRGEFRTMDDQLAISFIQDKVEVPRAKV